MREDIFEGILANDIVAFHTRAYRRNFLLCCRDLFDLEVDEQAGIVRIDDREVWVRAYPLPISAETFRRNAQRAAVHEYEREILRRRREHLILRVDRADLSKNVLRGFAAFDLFLEQHPEFKEQVTFIAHLIPSRQDVPEYAEYLERIEALVAVVNHRHGTTDWMPIELRLRENLEEAIAAYKHYDLLMVNAMFDGMNLIAKEGPLVNERHGVSLLSENTGAHEELAEFALSVNPFDVQEQADAIHRALTMSADERSWRAEGLKRVVEARDPGDWVDDQLADIEAKRRGRARLPYPKRGATSSGRVVLKDFQLVPEETTYGFSLDARGPRCARAARRRPAPPCPTPRSPSSARAAHRPGRQSAADARRQALQASGIKRMRVLVPYDAMANGGFRRAYLDAWFQRAKFQGIEPLVSFYRSDRGKRRIPSVTSFRRPLPAVPTALPVGQAVLDLERGQLRRRAAHRQLPQADGPVLPDAAQGMRGGAVHGAGSRLPFGRQQGVGQVAEDLQAPHGRRPASVGAGLAPRRHAPQHAARRAGSSRTRAGRCGQPRPER